jgi:hypothetical protein
MESRISGRRQEFANTVSVQEIKLPVLVLVNRSVSSATKINWLFATRIHELCADVS